MQLSNITDCEKADGRREPKDVSKLRVAVGHLELLKTARAYQHKESTLVSPKKQDFRLSEDPKP